MKKHGEPYRAKAVTLVTTVFIPELGGYWEESLDVLKVCFNSLFENTDVPYDLLVFDNASCPEVREYLLELHQAGLIQYLFLAHDNVAKLGCFNQVFPGTPGEYIGFFDSDVYFYPGWLTESIKVFETFDRVGTVTARPGRATAERENDQLSTTKKFVEQAPADVTIERGDLVDREILAQHYSSIGLPADFDAGTDDVRITRNDVSVYMYGSHFQFLTRRDVAEKVLPLPLGDHPLGSDRLWDNGINDAGYLRLGLDKPYVRHIGNSLRGEEEVTDPLAAADRSIAPTKQESGLVRKILLKLHAILSRKLYS